MTPGRAGARPSNTQDAAATEDRGAFGEFAFSATREAVAELEALAAALDAAAAGEAVREIIAAQRVFTTGVGRSGLMSKAIAMRLMHTGLRSFAVGEVSTPGITAGDLLVAFSAKGSGAIADRARTARAAGARVLAITATADSALAERADAVLLVPARTLVPTVQHAGSLFEQGCLVIGDALSAAVRTALSVPESELDRRHANLS